MRLKSINLPLLLRFLFVGGSTAVLFLGVTFGLVEVLKIDTTIASTLAFSAAMSYNYLLHYHFTFGTDAPHGVALAKYLTMCAGGLALNALVMELGVRSGELHYMVVQVIAAILVVIWSLTISSIWVFR